MQFTQIHHCSIPVQDLDRAVAFYRDVLGLTEIAIPPTFITAGLPVRWLAIGSQHIHLLLEEEASIPSQRHFALQVNDAQSARQQLRAQGIAITETVPIPGVDRFFIHDTEYNLIELIEWQETYTAISTSPATP